MPDNIDECAGAVDQALVPSSNYCNVFHVCLNGKRKDFRCAKASNSPYDLWWNAAIQRCDWPCNVQCNKRIFDYSNDAATIKALDKDNCQVSTATFTTVMPGYGKNKHIDKYF